MDKRAHTSDVAISGRSDKPSPHFTRRLFLAGSAAIGASLLTSPTSLHARSKKRPRLEDYPAGPYGPEIIGVSVEKRPILMWTWNEEPSRFTPWKDRQTRPTLILSTMHGNERSAGELGERLLSRWLSHPQELRGCYVMLAPRVNPDGWAMRRRWNADRVDINRNFPSEWEVSEARGRYYSGESPLSEPETVALKNLIDRTMPAKIISIHSPLKVVNYDGPGLELAEEMARESGYPVAAEIGYPTPGSLGKYTGGVLGIPTITLELPYRVRRKNEWSALHRAIMAAIKFEVPETGEGK